jgi:signal transduction histidine kinase
MKPRVWLVRGRRAGGGLAVAILWSVLSAGSGLAQASPPENARHVLLLYSSDHTLPATNVVGAGVLRELGASQLPKVDVRSDFLDMSRFKYPGYRDDLAAFLAKKYAGFRIDLVVALGPPALDFIATYRDRIAPGAKIVFGLVSDPELAEAGLPVGEVSGIVSDFDVAKTLELALSLQPDARRIVVVSGSIDYDRRLAEKARVALAPLAGRYEVVFLSDLRFEDVLQAVSRLPEDSILLVLSFFADAEGKRFVPREAGGFIARAATAPSYGPYDVFLGLGVVGGYTDTFQSTGVALGKLALDVLNGRAGPGGDRRNPEHAFRVDARQLERWNLSEANLPQGTVVLFAAKSLWQQYWHVVVAALGVIALQSALLAALLIQRARRRRADAARLVAEEAAEAQRREVAHMSRVLMLGELSGAVAHELNQPLTAILANAQAAQMMLAREAPDIDDVLIALEEIVEDDKRASQVMQRLRGLLKKDLGRWELVDLNDTARSAFGIARGEMVARRIDAELRLWPGAALVQGDPVQLQQVVLNLLVNAMDAVGGNDEGRRRIAVETLVDGGRALLRVADNGPGLGAAPGQLVQPFFTTKPHGLGLGLAICTSILSAHGGSLALATAPEGGARAEVTLPAAEMRAAAE